MYATTFDRILALGAFTGLLGGSAGFLFVAIRHAWNTFVNQEFTQMALMEFLTLTVLAMLLCVGALWARTHALPRTPTAPSRRTEAVYVGRRS